MAQKAYEIQLEDHITGEVILGAGGTAMVVAQGASSKVALLNPDGSTLANPVTLSQGRIIFEVADTVTQVDIYGLAPGGQFFRLLGVKPSGPNEMAIDITSGVYRMVIPFDVADQAGDNTETDSGFDEPANALMLPQAAVRVVTVDATETIDVGTLAADPNGFLAAIDVAVAGPIKGTLISTGQTLGALLSADESGAGVLVPESKESAAASISWTLSLGADTAAGFIVLPYMLS